MRTVAGQLVEAGHALAGFVQINQPRPGRSRCDMILQELASGERIGISQDRGLHARGCMLDVDELLRAGNLAMKALDTAPEMLLINKYGKTEAEGGGFRSLIAEALARDVPVLIAVPRTNLDSWLTFAEGLVANHDAETLPTEIEAINAALGLGATVGVTAIAE